MVEGFGKQLQRRSVWFEEYCQPVNSKTIGQFSQIYSSILPNLLMPPTCSSSIQKTLERTSKTTVLVLEFGCDISQNDYIYLGMLLSNLQEQDLRPIVVLANVREPVKWINEKQLLQRK